MITLPSHYKTQSLGYLNPEYMTDQYTTLFTALPTNTLHCEKDNDTEFHSRVVRNRYFKNSAKLSPFLKYLTV